MTEHPNAPAPDGWDDFADLPTARELAAEALDRDAPEALLADHRGPRRLTDEP